MSDDGVIIDNLSDNDSERQSYDDDFDIPKLPRIPRVTLNDIINTLRMIQMVLSTLFYELTRHPTKLCNYIYMTTIGNSLHPAALRVDLWTDTIDYIRKWDFIINNYMYSFTSLPTNWVSPGTYDFRRYIYGYYDNDVLIIGDKSDMITNKCDYIRSHVNNYLYAELIHGDKTTDVTDFFNNLIIDTIDSPIILQEMISFMIAINAIKNINLNSDIKLVFTTQALTEKTVTFMDTLYDR